MFVFNLTVIGAELLKQRLVVAEERRRIGAARIPEEDNPTGWWVTPFHFGIDQGPVVLMIENYRSGLIWDIMRRCPAVIAGLRRAGFTGGWL